MTPNSLYLGDNLQVLREHFPDESVDLVYLDPPFNSKRDYNYVFRSEVGIDDTAHIKAFSDTWSFEGASEAYHELIDLAEPVSLLLGGLHQAFGPTSLLGYLSVMALRLRELRRVLKPTGSLYLHCDETVSHYLKMVMDALLGPESFRTEVIWQRTNVHSDSRFWSDVRDSILVFSRSPKLIWNPQYVSHGEDYIRSKYRYVDTDGRRYRLDNMTSPNPRPNMMYEWRGHASPPYGWRYSRETMQRLHDEGRIWYPDSTSKRPQLKRYLDEQRGLLLGNVWTDIPPINSRAAERLGYPTQKPLALLERIVAASSNPGDLVLDPFCGCGTAVAAAQKLGRRWVGIDITPLAITLIRKRMMEHFPEEFRNPRSIPVHGLPVDVAGARMLAEQDRYAFEQWAIQLVGAAPAGAPSSRRDSGLQPVAKKRGADRGIDGVVTWLDGKDKVQRCLISVKSGHVNVSQVRDLVGTVQREGAAIGVLVTLEQPTGPMLTEAADAGRYKPEGFATMTKDFPRIQVVTVDQLLDGPGADLPRWRSSPHKEARAIETDVQRGMEL